MGLIDFIMMLNTAAIEAAVPPGTSGWGDDEEWMDSDEWLDED